MRNLRCPTSGRTAHPMPPAGVDSSDPQVCAPRHWAGRKRGGQAGTVFLSRSPSIRVRMRLTPWGPILPLVRWADYRPTRKHTVPWAPAPDRFKRLPFSQDTCPVYIFFNVPFATHIFYIIKIMVHTSKTRKNIMNTSVSSEVLPNLNM